MYELMQKSVRRWPQQEAFIEGERRISYLQFQDAADRVSAALQKECEIDKGDRVALLLGTGISFAVAYFGIVQIGAVVVPLNTRCKGEELSYEINDSGAKVLIADEKLYGNTDVFQDQLETITHIFVEGCEPPSGTRSFCDLTDYNSRQFESPAISEWDLLNIMYTSGTTGKPKGAMQFHRGMVATAMMTQEFLHYERNRDRILCVVPLFHATGLSMNLVAAVLTGIPVVFMKKFHPEEALQLIQRERITSMVSVVTVYWLMLNHENFDHYDLSSLREILYGGSPAAEDVILQMRERLPGVLIHNGYGMTETHAYDTHLMDEDAVSRLDSVGQILPLVDMKVVDQEGRELGPGEAGELFIKGCKVVRGYWRNEKSNRRCFTDGWLHTGDIARIDQDGYVYILDRIKEMINRGGEKIYSIEVENVLYAHPRVLEAAVFGAPDEVFGEQVKAAIVLKPGQFLTEEEIRGFCAERLADYKVPRTVLFLDELPRNPGGKVLKSQLREVG